MRIIFFHGIIPHALALQAGTMAKAMLPIPVPALAYAIADAFPHA